MIGSRLLLAGLLSASAALAGLLGPTPYLSSADSPFTGGSFSYFHLENFEDGALNTPGVSANAGIVLAPSINTDSVDGDDGAIDGSGQGGHSWFSNASTTSFQFTFNAALLGALPTHVGIVWTDIGQSVTGGLGTGAVTFEAFDENGLSLGIVGPTVLGDGSVGGGTAEDRFFGATNASGISSITISVNSADWEVDHLQYGLAADSIPEPSTVVLCSLSLLGLALRRFMMK